MLKLRFRVPLCCWLLAASTPALQTRPAHADTTTNRSDVKMAEAHFRRGVELFNEGNAEAAMVEFRRAHQLAPRFQILYNMAQVAYELNDYAAAMTLFERYLREGGAGVPDDRRKSVKEEIAKLRERVGSVRVVADLPGATVTVDDLPVGITPLGPQVVNIGRRRIAVSTADGRSEVRLVEVATGETAIAKFSLRAALPPRATAPMPPPPAPALRRDSNNSTVPWVLAATLGAGAGACSVLALQRSRELEEIRESYPMAEKSALRDKGQDAKRMAFIADGLWATAALAGTVALVITLTSSSTEAPASRVAVGITPSKLFVEGRF